MSQINGLGGSQPIQKLTSQPIHRTIPTPGSEAMRASDRVELSGAGHLLAALKSGDIRAEKVAEIKAQIEAGQYETNDKLDIAADRLLDDLEL